MDDTILWNKESDNYTKRAKTLLGDNLYNRKEDCEDADMIARMLPKIKSILDIGCAYGGFAEQLAKKYPKAKMVGIDLGKKTIALAKKNLPNIDFRIGYSHKIGLNEQFDLIVFRLVLQWVPRKYLLQTIAEIDRLCKGYIYIQEFCPNYPKTSISRHNKKVKIFKQDYSKIFTSLPYYRLIYKKIIKDEDDYLRRGDFLIKKLSLKDAYLRQSKN